MVRSQRFLRLGVSVLTFEGLIIFYVWGLVVLRSGVKESYIGGFSYYVLMLVILTFGG